VSVSKEWQYGIGTFLSLGVGYGFAQVYGATGLPIFLWLALVMLAVELVFTVLFVDMKIVQKQRDKHNR